MPIDEKKKQKDDENKYAYQPLTGGGNYSGNGDQQNIKQDDDVNLSEKKPLMNPIGNEPNRDNISTGAKKSEPSAVFNPDEKDQSKLGKEICHGLYFNSGSGVYTFNELTSENIERAIDELSKKGNKTINWDNVPKKEMDKIRMHCWARGMRATFSVKGKPVAEPKHKLEVEDKLISDIDKQKKIGKKMESKEGYYWKNLYDVINRHASEAYPKLNRFSEPTMGDDGASSLKQIVSTKVLPWMKEGISRPLLQTMMQTVVGTKHLMDCMDNVSVSEQSSSSAGDKIGPFMGRFGKFLTKEQSLLLQDKKQNFIADKEPKNDITKTSDIFDNKQMQELGPKGDDINGKNAHSSSSKVSDSSTAPGISFSSFY